MFFFIKDFSLRLALDFFARESFDGRDTSELPALSRFLGIDLLLEGIEASAIKTALHCAIFLHLPTHPHSTTC